jgi:C4-dicarboxylate-specific signal transduction histidine kinase
LSDGAKSAKRGLGLGLAIVDRIAPRLKTIASRRSDSHRPSTALRRS